MEQWKRLPGEESNRAKKRRQRYDSTDTATQIRRHRYGDTDTMAKIHSDTDTAAKKQRQRYGSSEKNIAAVPDERRAAMHDVGVL